MRNSDNPVKDTGATNRLHSLVAVSVAVVAVFMGVTKIKDDNIVQAMLNAKSNAVDTWGEYQSKKVKHHIAGIGIDQIEAVIISTNRNTPALSKKIQAYEKTIVRYEAEEKELSDKARAYEKDYDNLNFRDDQFDLSDAALSISLAMLAVSSLTAKRWLLCLAWGFAGFGLVMGLAGLFGLGLHPDWLTGLLS